MRYPHNFVNNLYQLIFKLKLLDFPKILPRESLDEAEGFQFRMNTTGLTTGLNCFHIINGRSAISTTHYLSYSNCHAFPYLEKSKLNRVFIMKLVRVRISFRFSYYNLSTIWINTKDWWLFIKITDHNYSAAGEKKSTTRRLVITPPP